MVSPLCTLCQLLGVFSPLSLQAIFASACLLSETWQILQLLFGGDLETTTSWFAFWLCQTICEVHPLTKEATLTVFPLSWTLGFQGFTGIYFPPSLDFVFWEYWESLLLHWILVATHTGHHFYRLLSFIALAGNHWHKTTSAPPDPPSLHRCEWWKFDACCGIVMVHKHSPEKLLKRRTRATALGFAKPFLAASAPSRVVLNECTLGAGIPGPLPNRNIVDIDTLSNFTFQPPLCGTTVKDCWDSSDDDLPPLPPPTAWDPYCLEWCSQRSQGFLGCMLYELPILF